MEKDNTVGHSDDEVEGEVATSPACEPPPYVSCHPASTATKRVILPLILSSVLCAAFPTHLMIKALNFQSSCLIHINHEHVASHMISYGALVLVLFL